MQGIIDKLQCFNSVDIIDGEQLQGLEEWGTVNFFKRITYISEVIIGNNANRFFFAFYVFDQYEH